jgi:endonuclease III
MRRQQEDEPMDHRDDVLARLLDRHGRTFADEMGIRLERGGPPELFQLLVGSLLMSARISADLAVAAARALFARGYTDADRMLGASWQDRVDALGDGGYVRYDERTATYLADTSRSVLDRYAGDLDQLRVRADGDPDRIGTLLQDFKGIGRVGADLFRRDAQRVWPELRPFADAVALAVADQLDLGASAADLADRVGTDDLSVLTAALVRARRSDDLEVVRSGAPAGLTAVQLARMTRDELYALARERDIPGRSSMDRAGLEDALR